MDTQMGLSDAEVYSVKLLTAVQQRGHHHIKILLKWLTTEYFLFSYGVGLYTNFDHVPQKNLFLDGMQSLIKNGRGKEIFPADWAEMEEAYEFRYTSENIRGGLSKTLSAFRRDPERFFDDKEKHYLKKGRRELHKENAKKIPEECAKLYDNSFLTTRDILDCPSKTSSGITPMWKCIPDQPTFQVMNINSKCEIWMDGNEIIAGRGVGKVTEVNSKFVRSYIKAIYDNQYNVQRSTSREAIGQTMRAVGPLINYRYPSRGKSITFYKNQVQFKKQNPFDSEILQLLHEQSSHRLLFEILLVLFATNFWPVLENLLDIASPFMEISQDLLQYFSEDKSCFKNGIPSYPLFITKNYCNMVHTDNDKSLYTLGLVSNPNKDSKGGYLTIVDYGLKIPLMDGDIFFFRGQDRHSTSFRSKGEEVYVVATAINNKLGVHFDHTSYSP